MTRSLLPLLCLVLVAGCRTQQRIAGPLWLAEEVEAVPRLGAAPIATVLRHSGPVDVRRPGAPDGYRLSYYQKEARVRSGAEIVVGPGGRAELLWETDASSVVLFGDAVAVVGDPERDEPMVRLLKLVAVQLTLTSEDKIVLPGGAEFWSEPLETTPALEDLFQALTAGGASTPGPAGPFRLESQSDSIVRVKNESRALARLRYRDVELVLAPGDVIDVPILSTGTAPITRRPDVLRTNVEGLLIESTGAIEPVAQAGGVRVRALEAGEVRAGGVRVRLSAGEEVVFSGLGSESGESAAPPQE